MQNWSRPRNTTSFHHDRRCSSISEKRHHHAIVVFIFRFLISTYKCSHDCVCNPLFGSPMNLQLPQIHVLLSSFNHHALSSSISFHLQISCAFAKSHYPSNSIQFHLISLMLSLDRWMFTCRQVHCRFHRPS